MEWESNIKGFSVNYINSNLWRFKESSYSFDDLLQEAWIVFDYCKKKYKNTSPANFMTLYKKALFCSLFDLGKREEKEQLLTIESPEIYENKKAEALDYNLMLQDIPEIMRNIVELLTDPPDDVKNYIENKKITNLFLCQLLDLNPNIINIKKLIINYFLEK